MRPDCRHIVGGQRFLPLVDLCCARVCRNPENLGGGYEVGSVHDVEFTTAASGLTPFPQAFSYFFSPFPLSFPNYKCYWVFRL